MWLYYMALVAIIGIVVLVRLIMAKNRWPELAVPPFYCTSCRRRYKSGEMLSAHIRAVHDELWGPLKPQLDMLKGRGMAAQSVQQMKPKRKRKPRLRVVR